MQVAVVTGANRGIGRVIARELAKDGYLVCAGVRDSASAEELRREVDHFEGRVEVVQLDVSDDASVEKAFGEVDARFGPVDVLVNNAGIGGQAGPLEALSIDAFRDTFETNFYGPLRTMKAVAGAMRERRTGTIVNISTIGTVTATGLLGPYVSSKFALEGLTLTLANQLSQYGVTVALVLPGFIQTEILAEFPVSTLPSDDVVYGRLIRRTTQSASINIPNAADPMCVADAVRRVIAGEGKLRNPAGPDMERLFERLGVNGWTGFVDACLLPDDVEWAKQVSDFFARDIPPPKVG